MRNSLKLLEHVVDTQALQIIQDDLAAVTEMAVLTVDSAGRPVTQHSKCTDFCKAMRAVSHSSRLCESCDFRGGQHAQSMQRPYVYKCHMGIVDIAVPLMAGSAYLGAIMLGQISIPGQRGSRELDLLKADGCGDQREQEGLLKEYYRSLPVMSYERVEAVAGLVTRMSRYITGSICGTGRVFVSGDPALRHAGAEAGVRPAVTSGKPLQDTAGRRTQAVQQESGPDAPGTGRSIRLKPALEHIHAHFRQRLTVAELAKLCWISTDHFSRLFRQETGQSFSCYINSLRLEEAKRCLLEGGESIVNIAHSLGYEDCGYFIRTFKKSAGLTPGAYRMQNRPE
ncbi:PocR ligand-binding domain-containing protein [Paenibacillus sp. MMS20-IR301]|uniref:PocR ligand-binding domain-containing protein n=1 Tax=Paenibacillus sp. MMS20-IR301 TaxID=2895946 RepID=UPI0028EF1354|nr:PocR ligand-binding domain-containing protein [Paenibacillus sp. MMS20-IR301]WNS41257.1 PocR ligand-binding domain-containing protein [Paenibacillus sp. MMS20-IR301]